MSLPPPISCWRGILCHWRRKLNLRRGNIFGEEERPSGWGKWELGGGRLGRQSAVYTARSHRCPRKAGRRRLEWCQLGLGGS